MQVPPFSHASSGKLQSKAEEVVVVPDDEDSVKVMAV